MSASHPAVATSAREHCWNSIGTRGDASCRELSRHIHCHRCPVQASALVSLLDSEPPADYVAEWTTHFAAPKPIETIGTQSVVIFRVGTEWLALPTMVAQEVLNRRTIHSLPHRQDGIVLGLTSVRGELLVCVSLGALLGVEPQVHQAGTVRHGVYPRMLVIRRDHVRVVCPIDDAHGIHRVHANELRDVPTTVANASGTHAKHILSWRGHSVGLLDDEILFRTLERVLS